MERRGQQEGQEMVLRLTAWVGIRGVAGRGSALCPAMPEQRSGWETTALCPERPRVVTARVGCLGPEPRGSR